MAQYKDVRLLFITRKYPPMIGGMESMSSALTTEFSKRVDTTLIAWNKSQKYLWYFLPLAMMKALFLIPALGITHVHLGDALLAPLGIILAALYGVRTSVTVAGLDITYTFPPYQYIVPRCVARLDSIICISHATLHECLKRNIPKEKCTVIPVGVYPQQFQASVKREELYTFVQEKVIANKKILITVGRLVPRKGVAWFIRYVFPSLSKEFVYVVIGTGPELKNIEALIHTYNLNTSVILLGRASDEQLKILYNTSDVFVMPNRKVEGNPEGFGIVAVEAASAGLPVVASDIDGISDAVIPGKTGMLCPPEDAKAMVRAIQTIRLKKSDIKNAVFKRYHWDRIGVRYANVLFTPSYG